jgi:hypothetical protein
MSGVVVREGVRVVVKVVVSVVVAVGVSVVIVGVPVKGVLVVAIGTPMTYTVMGSDINVSPEVDSTIVCKTYSPGPGGAQGW